MFLKNASDIYKNLHVCKNCTAVLKRFIALKNMFVKKVRAILKLLIMHYKMLELYKYCI